MDRVENNPDIAACVQQSTGKINTYNTGHSGHSSFLEKVINNNILYPSKEVGNKKDINTHTYKRLSEVAMSTVSKPETLIPDIQDPRFKSPAFRNAVRAVLQYFGYKKATYGDFKEVEAKFTVDGRCRLDWLEFSRRKLSPRYDAVVFVLDSMGRHIISRGKVLRKMVTLFSDNREEALKNLDKCFQFERWFE